MQVDLLLDTFGTTWPDVRAAAGVAERAGFDGVWVNDHLAGSVEGASHVLECWTVLSALAAEVPRIALGPLVLNVANRDPGTLAVMAATLQHVSAGRLLIGIGAGARRGSRYATEQEALGRPMPGDAERRQRVEDAVTMLRRVWSGAIAPASGFLQPVPTPPIVVAASGPKVAELAGRVADAICVPVTATMTDLVATARAERARSGRDRSSLLATALLSSEPEAIPQPVFDAGLDRLVMHAAPPFERAIARLEGLARRAKLLTG